MRAFLPFAVAAVVASCHGKPESAKAHPLAEPRPASGVRPTDEDYVPPELPKGRVVLKDAFGTSHVVEVEIAADEPSRERGLMWRTQLASGAGMLFVFPTEEEHNFWMRNTLIPLDMVFIGADRKIVGIVARATPRTLTSRAVGRPSQYVLEVPGGWCEQQGIRTGSDVQLPVP